MFETPEDKLLGFSNPEYDQSAKRRRKRSCCKANMILM